MASQMVQVPGPQASLFSLCSVVSGRLQAPAVRAVRARSNHRPKEEVVRHAAKVDANQAAIVKALKSAGINVEVIKQPFDLAIWHPRIQTAFAEVKNPDGKNAFTKQQLEFIARWPGRILVFRSPEDAVRQVLGEEAMA